MTKTKIGQVVSYIVILLIIVAVIGVVAHFTNGFTSDFKTFYVSVNGKDVMTSSSGYVITPQEPLSVDVKYTFAFNQSETKGYSVKIVPNKTDEDFDFTVDGETHYFGDEKDLSNGFIIDKQENPLPLRRKAARLWKFCKPSIPKAKFLAKARVTTICLLSLLLRITANRA